MKRVTAFFFLFVLLVVVIAGCSSKLDDQSEDLGEGTPTPAPK